MQPTEAFLFLHGTAVFAMAVLDEDSNDPRPPHTSIFTALSCANGQKIGCQEDNLFPPLGSIIEPQTVTQVANHNPHLKPSSRHAAATDHRK